MLNFAQKKNMELHDLYDFCLQKKGVSEHFPFDDDVLVFKVGGKIFLLTSISKWENGQKTINLKCNPELAIEQRERYQAVQPGFHMNKKHWNTINTASDLPISMIFEFINDSYQLVLETLSKKNQKDILES
jgi:predicted DNA-binding protein (MmcQ/YjbR family)